MLSNKTVLLIIIHLKMVNYYWISILSYVKPYLIYPQPKSHIWCSSKAVAGTQWILDLCNGIVKEGSIPEDWKSSVVLPIYKGKGDPM